jgi:hypothetical protein
MKCDLCGTNVTANNFKSYDEVEGSTLCQPCFVKLTSDKLDTSTAEITHQTYEQESGKSPHSEHPNEGTLNRLAKFKLLTWATALVIKGRKILIPWALLCLLSPVLGLKGCGTEPLISSAYRSDPKIASYNGFYFKDNTIIIDYSVASRRGDRLNYFIPAGDYWAEIDLDKTRNEYGYYKIHRRPLPANKIKGLDKLNVIDCDNTPLPLDPNLAPYFGLIDYAKKNYSGKPHVITRMSSPSHENIYLAYFDKKRKAVEVITHGPYDRYIPISQYPKIIVTIQHNNLLFFEKSS